MKSNLKIPLRILLAVVMMLVSVSLQSMLCDATDQCWYAAPTGSGSVCTESQPCSIEQASGKLSGGDILYLLPGTYSDEYINYSVSAIINFDKHHRFQEPMPSVTNPVIVKSMSPLAAVIEGDFSKQCIVVDKDNIQFDGLTVRQCNQAGIRIYLDVGGNNTHVRNSLLENITGSDNMGGVYIGNASGAVIENNEFRGNMPSTETNGNCFSIILFQGVDVTIRNNYIHDACGGIYFKHGESEAGLGGFTRIHGNIFEDIEPGLLGPAGIWMNQNRAEIFDNLLIGVPIVIHPNVDGTKAANSIGAFIHHNTVIDSYIRLDHKRESPSVGALNATVENNVFFNSGYSIWRFGSDESYEEGVGLNSNSNCFFNSTGSQSVDYFSSTSFGILGGNFSLGEFQSSLLLDTQSVESDPEFIAPASNNYRLSDSSLCKSVDAGVRFDVLPEVTDSQLCFPIKAQSQSPAVLCL